RDATRAHDPDDRFERLAGAVVVRRSRARQRARGGGARRRDGGRDVRASLHARGNVNRSPRVAINVAVVAIACVNAGCRLGPEVSDDPAPSGDIVPAGTTIPSIDEDEDAEVIEKNDGVDGVVPRLSAFAAGAPTHVWDFGPAPTFAAPLFRVM